MKSLFKIPLLIVFLNSCFQKPKTENNQEVLAFDFIKNLYITHNSNSYKIFVVENKDTIFIDEFIKKESVKNVAVYSSVFFGAFKLLNSQNSVKAIDKRQYYYDDFIDKGILNKQIFELGDEGNFNYEIILKKQFDLLVCNQLSSYFLLKKKFPNLKVLPCLSYTENQPLARAEWIKIFGLLTNQYEKANLFFEEVKKDYLNNIQPTDSGATFMCENIFSGVWYVPGGKSYTAQLIHDAGGIYLFRHLNKKTSYPLSFEQILTQAQNAKFWINAGVFETQNDLENSFKNYKMLNPFQNKQIYNPIKLMNLNGANDYWETAPYQPNLILKDYIKIIQQKSLDSMFYYQKLK